MLITISRQYGAGGSEVARLVASSLGWAVLDNEIVELVAQRAGLAADIVAREDEAAPTFVERLARALAASSQEYVVPELGVAVRPEEPDLVRLTELVVREAAAGGRVVLVGRAAPAVLRTAAAALHVRIVAPRAFRIQLAQQSSGRDARGTEQLMDETDARRGRYTRDHYSRDWNDSSHYHMVLNTGLLGVEGAAALIVAQARALGWGAP